AICSMLPHSSGAALPAPLMAAAPAWYTGVTTGSGLALGSAERPAAISGTPAAPAPPLWAAGEDGGVGVPAAHPPAITQKNSAKPRARQAGETRMSPLWRSVQVPA